MTDSINAELFGVIIYDKAALPYANIELTNTVSAKKYYKRSSDENGKFKFNIPSGTYKLKIDFVGLSPFEDSLHFKKGEIRELNIEMKEAPHCTSNILESNKELSTKELEQTIKRVLKYSIIKNKTMKIAQVILLFYFSQTFTIFGQNNPSKIFRESLIELDSLHRKGSNSIDSAKLKFKNVLKDILTKSELTISDSLREKYSRYKINNLTTGKYKLFSIQIDLAEHLSYILKDHKIINLEEMTSDYFVEIHPLDKDKYLLIKRNDNMSTSCYSAVICNDNYLYQRNTSNTTNSLGKEILFVCSFTFLENKNGIEYKKPIKIQFNPKTKILSYTFTSIKNGKNTTRRATYKNGKFSIKSYDEVLYED